MQINTEVFILLIFFAVITLASLGVGYAGLYEGNNIVPRKVLPLVSAEPTFTPLRTSGTINVPYQKVATPFVSETYDISLDTVPFLRLQATDNLSGQPCQPYILSETKTGFTAGILSCPPNGSFVAVADNENIQMVQFLVDNTNLPAILYVNGTSLYYQLAIDSAGIQWNTPKLLSSTFPSGGGKKLLNVNNDPVVSWLGSTVEFNFIKGNGPTWSEDSIALVTIALDDTKPVSISVFDMILMPTGFPVVIVQETTVANNTLQGVACGDAGTNTGWTAAWIITQAGTNNIVALTAPLAVSSALIRIINGKPAVAYTRSDTALYYSQNDSTSFPWGGALIAITATDADATNLDMVVLDTLPVILCSDATSQFILAANNTNGSSWTYANRVDINTTGGGLSAFYGNIVAYNTDLLISFIDEIRNFEYVIVPSDNLSYAASNNNMQNLDPTVGHSNYSTMAIIDGGITFAYVNEGQLFYFRPPTDTVAVDTSHQLNFAVIGV